MFNLTYKSIDVMKKSKDTLTSQLSTAEKTALVAAIKQTGCTHIAISVPLDDNSVWVSAGSTPSPRTVEAETMDWCDVIHAAGLKVMHRGSFGGIENIFNVAYDTGTSMGNAASSATDGNSTWCGRYYRYLTLHVGTHVQSGDIFAPIPEGTTHAFDGHWFASSQSAYMSLFTDLHTITNTYATAQSVTLTFMSHNNFSEIASGYMFGSVFSGQNMVGADYYGQRQGSKFVKPADYVTDWQQLYLGKDSNGGGANNAGGVQQFQGEWGDLPTAAPASAEVSVEEWSSFLIQFYKGYRDSLISPNGHMVGFNYWGGWEGQNTSLLWKTGSGASSQYFLNFRGKIIAAFFKSQGGMVRSPVVTAGTSADTYSF